MQPVLPSCRAPFARTDEALVGDLHRMHRTFDLAVPEIEEFEQFGEIRSQVVMLPEKLLQERGMVGKTVDDVGRRQLL